jgi:SAM-dependent methyltransferase
VVEQQTAWSAPAGAAEDFEFAALYEARNYRAAICRLFAPHLSGDILEVGAGIGQMLGDVVTICRPTNVAAVEPDSRFIPALRAAVPGAEVWAGSEQDIPSDRRFDAIYAINVLEHIADDRAELANWNKRIKPKGTVCLLVPARPELYAAIDADFGHHRRYTKRELEGKLAKAGFVSAKVRYFNMVGYFAWLINFRLLGKRSFDRTSVRAFDRLIFPLCRFFESTTRICPFGQSLVAIAKR